MKQYLYKARVPEASFGVEEVFSARWYYGSQSHVAQGHPPSMRAPEQCHRQFKRCLTDSPERTLLHVLDSLKESVDLWSSSRTRQEVDYTPFTCPGHCALRPCRPDEWMLTGNDVAQGHVCSSCRPLLASKRPHGQGGALGLFLQPRLGVRRHAS